MKELLEFLAVHWPELTAGFATVVALVTTCINLKKSSKLSQALKDAQSRGTRVICPRCKKTSPLSEVRFILPDGSPDQNLDGVPDHQE